MKNTLAFQIIVLYREFLAYTTAEVKKLGLNFGQIPLVVYTGKHSGCTQADLTKALDLDWGYSHRSINKLVDSGFITKKYDEEKGCNVLSLTASGEEAFDLCHKVFDSWNEIKLKDFSEEDKETLISSLKKIQEKTLD